jgi:hypothetical protein
LQVQKGWLPTLTNLPQIFAFLGMHLLDARAPLSSSVLACVGCRMRTVTEVL